MPGHTQSESTDTPSRYQEFAEAPSVNLSSHTGSTHYRRDDASRHDNASARRRASSDLIDSGAPQSWANLDEIAGTSPVENPDESPVYLHTSLEEVRSRGREYVEEQRRSSHGREEASWFRDQSPTTKEPTRFATQLYTLSYLVFFSILGTLARKGLAVLTTYPGTPISFDTIWVNFAGCLFIGFLVEDRKMFLYEWGSPRYHEQIMMERQRQEDEESGTSSGQDPIDLDAAKKTFISTKKGIPLYIGLTTGFCGSFTTFSGFMLDVFSALSNKLPSPTAAATATADRNGGYSFMAAVGVIVATVCLSLSGAIAGAHLAIRLDSAIPPLPYAFTRKFLDRLVVALGWGSWVGAGILCLFAPQDAWRGRMTFALIFAPFGTFARFYLALWFNNKSVSFPIGTFLANIFATALLASAWDMSHAAVGGVIGCQVLQGIQDGFCGCLSTVSTWVIELTSLERRHSYIYGSLSVLIALAIIVIIAGSESWSHGTQELLCST